MEKLLHEIRACQVCREVLPNPPRPVLQAGANARLLIIGQAPGQKVQQSGIPWDDQSGNELRRWLAISKEHFYNPELVALVPMGFCFPGSRATGDLPPRPECAPLWHQQVLANMKNVQLTLLIGQYAQKQYLGNQFTTSLTENVKNFRAFLPAFLPLVHPSPRNKIWHKKNPWFELEVVPELQQRVKQLF